MPHSKQRELTRALILALLAERGESEALVYLPRGMDRMRDMAEKLLALRPEGERSGKVDAILEGLNLLCSSDTAPRRQVVRDKIRPESQVSTNT